MGRRSKQPEAGASGGIEPGGEGFGKREPEGSGLREAEASEDRGFVRLCFGRLREVVPVEPWEGFVDMKGYCERI